MVPPTLLACPASGKAGKKVVMPKSSITKKDIPRRGKGEIAQNKQVRKDTPPAKTQLAEAHDQKDAVKEQIQKAKQEPAESKNKTVIAKHENNAKKEAPEWDGSDGHGMPHAPFFHTAFQKEIGNKWNPPAGFLGCKCTVMVAVSWDGAAQAVDIAEPSGVLVYDIAARSALEDVKMPKWAWGKSITIAFKQ